jgi:hypothetical protein
MPNGFESLGNLLGGGTSPLRQQAFMQGQVAQATAGHLSAQTQEALAQAKVAQLSASKAEDEQQERSNLADALVKIGLPADQALGYATVIKSGASNFEQATQGRGNLQTQGFRDTLADPNADPAHRLGASSAIQGKPVSPFIAVPQESVNALDPNITAPGAAPAVHDTPLADALVDKNTADANLNTQKALHPEKFRDTKDSGPKAPSGYEFGPDGKTLQPIKGGPHDPASATMGSRESTYFQRMVGSANQAIADIQNVVQLPVGATTGVLGVGASPGKSLLQAGMDTLKNTVASQDVQDYNSILPGLDRNLASIETAGLVPSGTFSESFSKLAMREGDTELTKLAKLAQMRQIIEKGLEPALANGRVSADQKAFVNKMISDVQSAVPFTRNDIIALRRGQEKNPSVTLGDIINQRNPGGKGSTAAPTAAAPSTLPTTNAKGWVLHKDAQGNQAYVSPDGSQYEEVQ